MESKTDKTKEEDIGLLSVAESNERPFSNKLTDTILKLEEIDKNLYR